MSEMNEDEKKDAEACDSGCCCGTTGGGSRMKWMICGVVALAALVTVAAHVLRTRAANSEARPQDYTAAIQAVAAVEAVKPVPATDAGTWAAPLKSIAELNQLAVNTEAVFVVLPSNDAERMGAVQKEVSSAASAITANGTKVGTFLLSRDAPEYAGLTQQAGSPAVLVMCKGLGMSAVRDQQVTQANLLTAFVTASRPSGCGPSGCGPGSSACK